MKKLLLGVVAFMMVGGASLISLQAHATAADPCQGCYPPGPKCCTASNGDEYNGNRTPPPAAE